MGVQQPYSPPKIPLGGFADLWGGVMSLPVSLRRCIELSLFYVRLRCRSHLSVPHLPHTTSLRTGAPLLLMRDNVTVCATFVTELLSWRLGIKTLEAFESWMRDEEMETMWMVHSTPPRKHSLIVHWPGAAPPPLKKKIQ